MRYAALPVAVSFIHNVQLPACRQLEVEAEAEAVTACAPDITIALGGVQDKRGGNARLKFRSSNSSPQIAAQTDEVQVDGQLLTCDPAALLPMVRY